MAQIKQIKIHNKSDKPDNILEKELEIMEECQNPSSKLKEMRCL